MPDRQSDKHFASADEAKRRAKEALSAHKRTAVVSTSVSFRRTVTRHALPGVTASIALVAFLWPFLSTREVSFTLSKEQTTNSDGRVLMTNLRYTGVDRNDRLFLVKAREGEQEDPSSKRVRLSDITAEIDFDSGEKANLKANSGLYRLTEEELSLTGNVTLQSGTDFFLQMAGAEIDLGNKTAYGQGNVRGRWGPGTVAADELEFFLPEKKGILSGGVKFHIVPEQNQDKTVPQGTQQDQR